MQNIAWTHCYCIWNCAQIPRWSAGFTVIYQLACCQSLSVSLKGCKHGPCHLPLSMLTTHERLLLSFLFQVVPFSHHVVLLTVVKHVLYVWYIGVLQILQSVTASNGSRFGSRPWHRQCKRQTTMARCRSRPPRLSNFSNVLLECRLFCL